MMAKKIITSLYVYKYSLFVAYLDGTIDIIRLPEFRAQFSRTRSRIPFTDKISQNSKMVVGMQALQNVLFVATSNRLINYELGNSINDVPEEGGFYKNVPGCQKIIINYSQDILYVLTIERGIIAINIKNVHQPKYINDLETSALLDIGDGGISGIDVMENSILLSIRNKGIYRVFIAEESKRVSVEREIQKIQLEDVQDVKHVRGTNFIYVVDSSRGFLVLDTTNNTVNFEANLPNEDNPKSIYLYYRNALIRGAKGLYLFNPRTRAITKVLDEKIGPMDSYYNHFFYSQQGKIKLLVLSSSGQSDTERLFDKNKISQIDVIRI